MKKEIEEIKEELVSYLEEAGEYCDESDIPKSAEECKRIVEMLVENDWMDSMPTDEEIKKLYPLFLEDWIQFTGGEQGFPFEKEWKKGGKKK